MKKNLAKTYDPKAFEDRIYHQWEESGAFKAHRDPNKKPFTIVMPPPNITGQLHMGHALDQTLQDALTRYKRLRGYSALWLPGSDHASIATEAKLVEKLREEGKSKEEIGREAFLERAWDWKKLYGGKITEQCRKLGNSCDWSRERFTMDEGCNIAVNHFFVKLYEKGYIYRGNRLINWCPKCGTSLSDAEVEHEDKQGNYWYFRYPAADGGQGIVVATARPETMFGDVAIAVHPNDERYKNLIGKKVILPLVGKEIPIIADPYPDPSKGTGAVKITPAHDANDFEVGERHKLDKPSCINPDGTMNELAGKYQGMDRFACRKAWAADLKAAGHLEKLEEKTIPIGTCYRCSTVVEPMLSDQWFVAMKELAKPAIEVAKNGELTHVPERFEKIYLRWLEEIRDWCISRQLWWGHRIPAWHCAKCGELTVAETTPNACCKCGSKEIHQDEDVLDTWFSSGLWPFSTLGWPEETEDLDYFYPTDVLVTAYDILFFWVIRMVFSALEITGQTPFKYAFIHGLVKDTQGRKMSKSLGNGIDPLEIINECGADALRFMLSTGISLGGDMRFQEDKLEGARNFANKLWNASRFVIMNLQAEDGTFLPMEQKNDLKDEDKWMLSRVNQGVQDVTESMEKFDLAPAGQRVYELIWNEYCDWYIELVKSRLYGEDPKEKETVRYVLVTALRDILRMLHPFMPFITEEIWSHLPKQAQDGQAQNNQIPGNQTKEDGAESKMSTSASYDENFKAFLINDSWPTYDENLSFPEEEKRIEMAMNLIKAIRNIRAEAEALPSRKLRAVILADVAAGEIIDKCSRYIQDLANVTEITITQDRNNLPREAMSAVIPEAEIFIPLDDLVDFQVEFERLSKEQQKLEEEIKRISSKLSNQGFVSKAPEQVVNREKEKRSQNEEMLAKITQRLSTIKDKVKL